MTWQKCGHPRTPENTANRTKPQCRICKQAAMRRANEKYRHTDKCRDSQRRYDDSVKGLLRKVRWNATTRRNS